MNRDSQWPFVLMSLGLCLFSLALRVEAQCAVKCTFDCLDVKGYGYFVYAEKRNACLRYCKDKDCMQTFTSCHICNNWSPGYCCQGDAKKLCCGTGVKYYLVNYELCDLWCPQNNPTAWQQVDNFANIKKSVWADIGEYLCKDPAASGKCP